MGKDKLRRGSRNDRHVRLYSWLTNSAAWTGLSGNAVKLLVYLAGFEDGRNNGELFMSERMAAEGIGVSKRTAGKLFDQLEEHGFVRATAKGYFSVKRGPATKWRLTWQSWPAASMGPTNEWRQWNCDQQNSRAKNLHATEAKIAPLSTAHRNTGAIIAPVEADTVESLGAKSSPHTIASEERAFEPTSPVRRPSGQTDRAAARRIRLRLAVMDKPYVRRASSHGESSHA